MPWEWLAGIWAHRVAGQALLVLDVYNCVLCFGWQASDRVDGGGGHWGGVMLLAVWRNGGNICADLPEHGLLPGRAVVKMCGGMGSCVATVREDEGEHERQCVTGGTQYFMACSSRLAKRAADCKFQECGPFYSSNFNFII